MKQFLIIIILVFLGYTEKVSSSTEIDSKIAKKLNIIRKETDSLFYVIARNGLSMRNAPNLKAKKIGLLKYLEPVYIVKDLKEKKEVVYDGKDTIEGNWVLVKNILYPKKQFYVFNGYLREKIKLKDFTKKEIDIEELSINGTLKLETNIKAYYKTLNRPDSIRTYKRNDNLEYGFESKQYNKIDSITYIYKNSVDWGLELWHYDNKNARIFYNKGIVFEELNENMSFVSINFENNQDNYLDYRGYKLNNQTTLKEMSILFPMVINPSLCTSNEYCLFEVGYTRYKNQYSETYWHIKFKNNKLFSFNIYYYD